MGIRHILGALFMVSVSTVSSPACASEVDPNFMLVLRETVGAAKSEFGLKPFGPATATLASDETVTFEMAWFQLIGDIQVRFVIDGESSMQNIELEELRELGISAERGVELAIANIRSRYGAPSTSPWEEGVMLVEGDSPDFNSSYLLDAQFWSDLSERHPDGLIVGVPKRGGLIYAPASDDRAVSYLEANIQWLYQSSEEMRVSSALYRYKDGSWSLYRMPASVH